jgi:2-phospho-L-lactate transferase/gluconeogenesis factor (CofD/UPF0052 family)
MHNKAYKKIVCLGGGIGTSNLIRGLKRYTPDITVVTSMADDGGSSGKLRRLYNVLPPGDLVSCIAALQPENFSDVSQLLTYRFPEKKNTPDDSLSGQKLGNLLMVAAYEITGDFSKAIELTKKIFHVTAHILPATDERVSLWAITKEGKRVHGETTLDLGMYSKNLGLKKVYLKPSAPAVNKEVIKHLKDADVIISGPGDLYTKVIKHLKDADVIISGPGDLYTNQIPVLIVPEIKTAVLKSKAKKVFILNVANKPFETKGFTLSDFIEAFTIHLDSFPFDTVIANNNQTHPFPKDFHYEYLTVDSALRKNTTNSFTLIEADIINEQFPIYHDSEKLASCIIKQL